MVDKSAFEKTLLVAGCWLLVVKDVGFYFIRKFV